MDLRWMIPVLAVSALAVAEPPFTRAATPVAPGAATPGAAKPPAAAPRAVLPFIADDYAKAVAEAKARQVPLFVESWAPW